MAQYRTIVIDHPLGGWIRTPAGGSSGASREGADDQYENSTNIDLFRPNGFEGYIAPGEMFQDMAVGGVGTAAINALPLEGVVGANSRAYVVLRNSRLIYFDVADDIIDGTVVVGTDVVTTDDNDMILFQDNNGTNWVARTYERNGDSAADIARINVTPTTPTGQDDDWFSTLTGSGTLTKGVPHKLWLGPDRIIYGANGRYILSHDPATTSGNTQAFDLGVGWTAVAGIAYGDYNAIIARKSGTVLAGFVTSESLLLLWDGFTPTPDFVYPINDYEATAIKIEHGLVHIFSQGRNNMTRVSILSGNQLITIFESTLIGNSPKSKSVESFREMTIWGQDSGSFLVSALAKNGDGFAHHQIMLPNVSAASPSDIGLLKNLSTTTLYAGITSGASTIVRINNSSYYPNADFTTKLYKPGYQVTITKIKFYLAQFGAGASFTASLFENFDSLGIGGANDLLNRQFTQATWGSVDEISVPIYIPNLSAFYMNIRFDHVLATNTATIIKRIEIEYTPTNSI